MAGLTSDALGVVVLKVKGVTDLEPLRAALVEKPWRRVFSNILRIPLSLMAINFALVLNVLSQVLISNHHSQNFSLNRYVQTKGPFSAGFISF